MFDMWRLDESTADAPQLLETSAAPDGLLVQLLHVCRLGAGEVREPQH